MKFTQIALALLSTAVEVAFATPVATQTATLGYASLNGGTSGGVGGATTTVSSLAALKTAVADDVARIVYVSGAITGNEVVKIGANKSVLGVTGSSLTGVGLRVVDKKNVIIRNMKISKVLADAGDAIGIQGTEVSNIWIDGNDISSDRDHEKDYYDGLLDITHGVRFVSVTYNKFHDHWKGSLVGHSDSNGSEDTVITVTYAYNYWTNINSRLPSFRFGTGHIFNSFFENCNDGIQTRQGAQLLIENNVFSSVSNPIFEDGGYAVVRNNQGATPNTAPTGTLTDPGYPYPTLALTSVQSYVVANAGVH